MVPFYLLPSPPVNPGDKSSSLVPGLGNCLKPSYPGGRRAGQIENKKYVTCRFTPDRVEKTAYFQGKSLEFVADWLEKNNLSKLNSVFEGTFILNC